jgi:hypothetical protein
MAPHVSLLHPAMTAFMRQSISARSSGMIVPFGEPTEGCHFLTILRWEEGYPQPRTCAHGSRCLVDRAGRRVVGSDWRGIALGRGPRQSLSIHASLTGAAGLFLLGSSRSLKSAITRGAEAQYDGRDDGLCH